MNESEQLSLRPVMLAARTRYRWWLFAFVALALSAGATWLTSPTRTRGVQFAPATKECAEGSALGHAFSYCIYRARSGTQGGLVYHFHGRQGDAHGWNDGDFFTGQIQDYWSRHKRVPPTVVSVSFGPTWLMMPRTTNALSGVLDVFTERVMPEVERRVGPPRYRALLGASMGGFNALLAALHRPELETKGIDVTWQPLYGGHCAVDIASVATRLIRD